MRLKIILRYCGISLIGVSILMFISAFIALFSEGDGSFLPLAVSGTITATAGIFPLIFVPSIPGINTREGFCVVAFSWISVCIFGALPFLMYGGEFTVVNAFFESVSGFTTTGGSILTDIESLPPSLQFWRIATAWIGGIGIITLVSIVTPSKKDSHFVLATAESSNLARDYFGGRKQGFVKMMLSIYIAITLVTVFALKLAGMEWFDAVTHAMSACSTAGFSTKNASVAFFNNLSVEIIIIVAMMTGATNFSLIFASLRLRGRKEGKTIFHYEVVRTFLLLVLAGIISVTAGLLVSGRYTDFFAALRVAAFQVCSISSNTGFVTTNTDLWPPFCIVIILICSMVCGCSGSTSGGFKVDRALLTSKALIRKLRSLGRPSMVNSIKVNGVAKSEEDVSDAALFIFLYLAAILIGSLGNTLGGLDARTGISAAIACMGNVGPGFGLVGDSGCYAALPDFLKLWNMFLMLLGRLEIYPLLFVLGVRWRRE